MVGGRSSSRSTSTTSTDVQNINLQDIDGVAVLTEGNVAITQSDAGAIEAGRQIAIAGLDTGLTGFRETVDLTREVLQAGRRQTETVAGIASSIAARESGNTDARLEGLTRTIVIGSGIVLVVVLFNARSRN